MVNKLEIFDFYTSMIKSLMEIHLNEDEQNKVLDILDKTFHILMKKVNDDGRIDGNISNKFNINK